MRKKAVITMIIILAFVLTGCGRAGNTARQNEAGTKQQALTNTEQGLNNPAAPAADSSAANQAASSSASTQAAGSTAIVAKSGNIVSSSDKEALLNEVDRELDALLTDVNNLDDVQDADLDLNP